MITHRNAAMNTSAPCCTYHIGVGERYLWTLPMFHANGWTFPWTMTAAGGTHVCLRKVEPAAVFRLIRDEQVRLLCAAPTVLISLASAPAQVRGEVPPGVRVVTAGAPPAAATIERLEGEFGWEVTHVYGLTETAPFILVCAPLPEHEKLSPADSAVMKARQGVELITSGELRVVDDAGRRCPPTGRPWARSWCGETWSCRATTTTRRPPSGRWATAGSTAATPPSCTRTATWRSGTG